MELDSQLIRGYRYPGGRLWAAAGLDYDGSVVVAVVVGSRAWFRTGEQLQMLNALSNLYLYPEELDL
jgi:hypothetical protein